MGIRASLEEQGKEENLRLEEFVFEEEKPSQELEFDVEKEITKKDWQDIIEILEICRQKKVKEQDFFTYDNYIRGIAHVLTIAPERRAAFSLDESTWKKMRTITDKNKAGIIAPYAYFLHGPFFRIIFPQEFDQMKNVDLSRYEKELRTIINNYETESNWGAYLDDVINFAFIFPDLLSTLDYEKHYHDIKNYLLSIGSPLKAQFPEHRLKSLANFNTLFPGKIKELNIKKDWEKIKKIGNDYRKTHDNMLHFLRCKTELAKIAASEVKITKNGIQLVMSEEKKFKKQILKRPERREA